MAFPTDSNTPLYAVNGLLTWAKTMRDDAAYFIAQCDAGSLNVYEVARTFMVTHLSRAKINIQVLAAVPGVFDLLAEQKPAAFTGASAAQAAVDDVIVAINDMISFLEANLPMDAERRLLAQVVSEDGTGTLSHRMITAGGALTAFRAQLVTFRDAFEA